MQFGNRFPAGMDVEFAVDPAHMHTDGVDAQSQSVSDGLVWFTFT
jgi:hypothetical protein